MPFRRLIAEYDTTYDDLRRVAEALDVPRPTSGYWKKHAAGLVGEPPPLPEPRPGHPVARTIVRLSVAAAEEARRWSGYEAAVGQLRVPKSLRGPHPLVAGWVAERRQGKRHTRKQFSLAPSYFTHGETDDRRHRILQALLPALERQGARITGSRDEEPIVAWFAGGSITFRLREKLKQERRPLSREEMKRGWGTAKNYHIELHPTGLLIFTIEPHTGFCYSTWEDDRGGPLEDRVTDIAVTILRVRDSQVASTLRAQARQAEHEERERRRVAAADARRRDDERWALFVDLSRRLEEAERLRRFLDLLVSLDQPVDRVFGDRTVGEWLAWARARIEATDPLAGGPASVYERLSRGDALKPSGKP